jgi:hypothetical protein
LTGGNIFSLFIAGEFVVLAEDVEEEAKVVEENVKVQIAANKPENKIKAKYMGKEAGNLTTNATTSFGVRNHIYRNICSKSIIT